MKTLASTFLLLQFGLLLLPATQGQTVRTNKVDEAAPAFNSAPVGPFESVEQMQRFARTSTRGSGYLREFDIGGQRAWVMYRTPTFGAPCSELSVLRCTMGIYHTVLNFPMSPYDFEATQEGRSVVVKASNGTGRGWVTICRIDNLPPLREPRQKPISPGD